MLSPETHFKTDRTQRMTQAQQFRILKYPAGEGLAGTCAPGTERQTLCWLLEATRGSGTQRLRHAPQIRALWYLRGHGDTCALEAAVA